MPHLIRSLAAIVAGLAGILFVSRLGMGAAGGYLLVVVAGTILFSAIGGRSRVLYTSIFAWVFFAGNLFYSDYNFIEWLMAGGITIAAPVVFAAIVSRITRSVA